MKEISDRPWMSRVSQLTWTDVCALLASLGVVGQFLYLTIASA